MEEAKRTLNILFAEMLRKKRIEKGISQQELADMIHVERSTLSGWETGRRSPDISMISLLSKALQVDIADFLHASEKHDKTDTIIVIDDEKINLDGAIDVLREVLPDADIHGFINPADAKTFLLKYRVQLVIMDIEMGRISGLDLCREFLEINPILNIFFLTAYPQYSLEAWKTGARGFLEKPLNADDLRTQLAFLRYPIEDVTSL